MKIIGTGRALPSKVVTNEMLAEFLDTSDEWITERTGIKERRLITDVDLIELAAEAGRKAIEMAAIDPKDIDYLICSNVANNFVSPGMGCVVLGKVGAECPTFDLNGACNGFLFSLEIADSFLKTGRAKNILIVCAEEPSKYCDWTKRDTTILFGDGAGAVVVTQGEPGIKAIKNATVSKYEPLYYQLKMEPTPYDLGTELHNPLVMNGREVFRMAVSCSTRDIDEVIKAAGLTADDIDMYLLHQANLRIIDSIRKHLGEPEVKFPTNLQRYGNTSSASIPILMDELWREGKLKRGQTLVLSAFGAGFVSGACVLEF